MSEVNQRFEQVFKVSMDEMNKVNIDVYGIAMATIMKPALVTMKPIFQLIYEQGVKDGKAESKEGEMLLTTDEVELIKTCDESPEQYIAVFQGQQIGYLRLRHGEFRVDYPDCGDETIFYTQEPQGDGCFEDDEREHFLMKAKEAIVKKFNEMEG